MMKKLAFVFGFVFWMGLSFGQDLLTPFLDSSFQQTYFNPSTELNKTVTITTGLNGSLFSNGPNYNQIVSQNAIGDNYINLKAAAQKLNENNALSVEANVHTLDIGFHVGKVSIFAGHAWKLRAMIDYPQDLALLVTNGNAPYIGQTLNIGPDFVSTSYNEIYLGGNVEVAKVRVGIKVKYLSGVENVSTERREIKLTTSEDIYQISLESDYLINTSRLLEFNDITDFKFNYEGISFKNFLTKNTGLAFDLGFNMDVTEKVNLGLSILDIGEITWDNDPENFTSNLTRTFDGIDLVSYLGDTTTIVLEDSLYNLLQFEKSRNAYTTSLPTKFILTAKYKMNETWTFGAIFFREHFRESKRTAIGLNTLMNINQLLSVGANYSASNANVFNIGISGLLHLGPVQAIATCDNIFAVFNPLDHNSVGVRLGLAFKI